MDIDFLEEYNCREGEFWLRFVDDVCSGKFIIHKDESPYKKRYSNIQSPIAELNRSNEKRFEETMWAQIPFSGSSILALPAVSKDIFERLYFDTRSIPKIVDFVKETGRLQFALSDYIPNYEGLDYLDPILQELKPPAYHMTPMGAFASNLEIQNAKETFDALASINFTKFLDIRRAQGVPLNMSLSVYAGAQGTFMTLKLTKNSLAEEAERLIVDDPAQAINFLSLINIFIEAPTFNLLTNIHNFPLDRIKQANSLSDNIGKLSFDHEIGKLLMSKLTYAPCGMDACKEIMYHYDRYDLQKVQDALNEGISKNNPDAVNSSAAELNEALNNVWEDKTLPHRIKGLKFGIPMSLAALGAVAAGPIGATGGFLASLGFDVASQMLDIKTDGLSERLAKISSRSYQINVFDFKNKYKIK